MPTAHRSSPSTDDGIPRLAGGRSGLAVYRAGDAGRAEVEDFIGRVYAAHFGARVTHYAPCLVAVNGVGGIEAAAGYRPADGPLFLERYLDAPVERLLATRAVVSPTRSQIVEVGHLAAVRPGAGRRLILGLGQHLARGPYQWVVSTLTEELRDLFVRMGVTPLALGVADPARLGDEARAWGRYYEHHPVVLAGHLPLALRRLAARRSGT
jgi:hypothetical protein